MHASMHAWQNNWHMILFDSFGNRSETDGKEGYVPSLCLSADTYEDLKDQIHLPRAHSTAGIYENCSNVRARIELFICFSFSLFRKMSLIEESVMKVRSRQELENVTTTL